MNENLKIAVQKKGRLYDGSMALLKECGIDISNGNNQLRVQAANFPLEVFFLRDDDIPEYVQDAVADIGFVGENVITEKNKQVISIEKLGFGKCRLSVAIPNNGTIKTTADLGGKKIATSYPLILSKYLKEKNIAATIQEISGSVEIAPRIGLADAICDLVSSGSTLFSNELKELEIVLKSEAVLISFSLTVNFFSFTPSNSFVYLRTALSPFSFTLSRIFFTVFSNETFSKTGRLTISSQSSLVGCFITFIIIILFKSY